MNEMFYSLLSEQVDNDNRTAAIIACAIIGGVILFCALFLIIKHALLHKKYIEDEKFADEVSKKMKKDVEKYEDAVEKAEKDRNNDDKI